MDNIKSLVIDLETIPLEGYFWRLFDENIGINQIKSGGGVLSWSAKWAGSDEIYFSSIHHYGHKAMVESVWELMDEADELIGWNSNRFDIPHLNTEFIKLGMSPPSPFKKIDLMRTVKGVAKFPSNKLDYVSQALDVGQKVEHEGFPLWIACLNGDKEAWNRMREYNEQDVLLTEELYFKLLPWITTGVNRSAIQDGHVCPNCGSIHLHSRGTTRTLQLSYKRWQCQSCGTWSRSVVAEKKSNRKERLVLAR